MPKKEIVIPLLVLQNELEVGDCLVWIMPWWQGVSYGADDN